MRTRLARRIFGLPPLADRYEVQRAHARLRAHVERRVAAGAAQPEELEQLDTARDVLVRLHARLGLALVSLSLAVLLGFAVWVLWGLGVGFGTGSGSGLAHDGQGVAPVGVGTARLVAPAGIEGARLVVTDPDSGEILIDAPADARVHTLGARPVHVRVQHPDCGSGWEQALELAPGAQHALEPVPCPETGWLVVESDGAADRLAIDGEPVGETSAQAHPVPRGRHEVRVERAGHEAWEGRVEIEPGRTLALRASPRERQPERREPVDRREPRPQPNTPTAAQAAGGEGDQRFGSWHERASQWLLSLYDVNRSNSLDTAQEVRAVPCRSWTGLAESYAQQGLALPLTRLYGFDGDGFVDGALGVAPRVRDIAYDRMRECGLQ